jgi:CDP-diacylglycerol---serine O-phosphatidyltransferase
MKLELQRNIIIPSLVTIGNGICGFYALWLLSKVNVEAGSVTIETPPPAAFAQAAWLILLGMVFDVFDGKVARMSGGSSALGAQLDSLCDLVTFGLVPSVLTLSLSEINHAPIWWQRATWFFSLAYFLGAMLRLARFTAENEPDEEAHLAFKGLPTPGAAGCMASLVIFYSYVAEFQKKELQLLSGFIDPETLKRGVGCIPWILPPLALVLGYTMVSNRLVFEHVGSRLFSRKHSFDFFVYLIFGVIVAAVVPEILLPILFFGYLLHAPVRLIAQHVGQRRAAEAAADEIGR